MSCAFYIKSGFVDYKIPITLIYEYLGKLNNDEN